MAWDAVERRGLAIVAGTHAEYKAGDALRSSARVDDGFDARWKVWRRWSRSWILAVVQRLAVGTESLMATSGSLQRKLCCVIPRFLWRGVIMPSTRRVLLWWFMELVDGRTRSPCFKRCASGVFCACAGGRTTLGWITWHELDPLLHGSWRSTASLVYKRLRCDMFSWLLGRWYATR